MVSNLAKDETNEPKPFVLSRFLLCLISSFAFIISANFKVKLPLSSYKPF